MPSTIDILGFASEEELDSPSQLLLTYALSIFEGINTLAFSTGLRNKQSEYRVDKAKLFILSQHTSSAINVNQLGLIGVKAPILLLTTSSIDSKEDSTEFIKTLTDSDFNVWDTYHLPHFTQHFNREEGIITPVNHRLTLIRKINHLIDEKLFLRDNSPSSCGINRFNYERGDEDDY